MKEINLHSNMIIKENNVFEKSNTNYSYTIKQKIHKHWLGEQYDALRNDDVMVRLVIVDEKYKNNNSWKLISHNCHKLSQLSRPEFNDKVRIFIDNDNGNICIAVETVTINNEITLNQLINQGNNNVNLRLLQNLAIAIDEAHDNGIDYLMLDPSLISYSPNNNTFHVREWEAIAKSVITTKGIHTELLETATPITNIREEIERLHTLRLAIAITNVCSSNAPSYYSPAIWKGNAPKKEDDYFAFSAITSDILSNELTNVSDKLPEYQKAIIDGVDNTFESKLKKDELGLELKKILNNEGNWLELKQEISKCVDNNINTNIDFESSTNKEFIQINKNQRNITSNKNSEKEVESNIQEDSKKHALNIKNSKNKTIIIISIIILIIITSIIIYKKIYSNITNHTNSPKNLSIKQQIRTKLERKIKTQLSKDINDLEKLIHLLPKIYENEDETLIALIDKQTIIDNYKDTGILIENTIKQIENIKNYDKLLTNKESKTLNHAKEIVKNNKEMYELINEKSIKTYNEISIIINFLSKEFENYSLITSKYKNKKHELEIIEKKIDYITNKLELQISKLSVIIGSLEKTALEKTKLDKNDISIILGAKNEIMKKDIYKKDLELLKNIISKEEEIKAREENEHQAKMEAERLAEEKAAAEKAQKEAEEKERLAKEEADRLAEEKAAAEQARRDAEEKERLAKEEADRLAAEKAAAEQARKEAEEKERLAKEEADRLAEERAAVEKAQRDAEEKERLAKEEADRLAAEKAAVEKARMEAEEKERMAKKEAYRQKEKNDSEKNNKNENENKKRDDKDTIVGKPMNFYIYVDDAIPIKMIGIESASYTNSEGTKLILPEYWISETEITKRQYMNFLNKNKNKVIDKHKLYCKISSSDKKNVYYYYRYGECIAFYNKKTKEINDKSSKNIEGRDIINFITWDMSMFWVNCLDQLYKDRPDFVPKEYRIRLPTQNEWERAAQLEKDNQTDAKGFLNGFGEWCLDLKYSTDGTMKLDYSQHTSKNDEDRRRVIRGRNIMDIYMKDSGLAGYVSKPSQKIKNETGNSQAQSEEKEYGSRYNDVGFRIVLAPRKE